MMTTGASCIGEFLKENCTLKVLYMYINHIGDVGISQLMMGLQSNTSLTKLSMQDCGISAKGTTCNSCNTGGSGLPDMYTLTLGPHVYMSDKAQPHVLQITCFTSLKYWKLQRSTEVHVVQLITHWFLVPECIYRSNLIHERGETFLFVGILRNRSRYLDLFSLNSVLRFSSVFESA